MTTQQVASDSRCLYIWNKQVYNIGSRNNPHRGHACGTDVTSVMPSSHLQTQASYLLPSYIANICTSVTNTPIPTFTITPTSTPTIIPTATVTPLPTGTGGSNTTVALTVSPHGIGSGGDNANPNGTGNTTLKHPQRTVTLSFFNGQNNLVGTVQGLISFNTSTANFQGNVTGNVPAGTYIINIKLSGFLSKQIPGIFTISSGQTITMPVVSLVTGDINNDGQIDVMDFILLNSCFGTKQNTPSCLNAQASDLNDDGLVDAIDYNLFLRELSVQKGT